MSVIIPTHNRRAFLAEAIASVFSQNYTDFELIVVDDGSSDDTAQLLHGYGDALQAIYQPNAGVSAARNRGIEIAAAPLIAFLDSDDLWLPEKLAQQVAFFESHPEALICQTEEIWIRNGVRVNPKYRHRKPTGDIFERSLALCLVSPSAVMMRRSLFERVGLFDEQLPACEDYDLWLRVSSRFEVDLIDTPLTIKRGGHADQLSRAPGLDRHRIRSLDKLLRQGRLNPRQRRQAAAMLIEKCRIYVNGCRRRGREAEAEQYDALAGRWTFLMA